MAQLAYCRGSDVLSLLGYDESFDSFLNSLRRLSRRELDWRVSSLQPVLKVKRLLLGNTPGTGMRRLPSLLAPKRIS
jgi:hypothetical protein